MGDIKGMLVRPSAGPVLIENSEQNVSDAKDGIDLASAYQQSLVAIDDMAKSQGLIPSDPAEIGNSYRGVVVGVSEYHTLVKVSDGVGVRHENDTLSRPMAVGECVKLDLDNPRVIERGEKSIEGQDTGKQDGRLAAIDPGEIEKVASSHRDNTPKLDDLGQDQGKEPASEHVTIAMQIEG